MVDTVGTNGRAWLDQQGKPNDGEAAPGRTLQTDQCGHARMGCHDRRSWRYTKPFELKRTFERSNVPFMQSPWNCSVRDNLKFTESLLETAAP